MQYRPLGNTGISISALGFGAMRLPATTVDGRTCYDHEAGIALIRQGIDAGINFLDSAPFYCEKESETIVGKALQDGYRSRVYLSTKLPRDEKGYDPARARLEKSLTDLNTDYIDFYHFWSSDWEWFSKAPEAKQQLKMVRKAKDEGLIRHICFSVHDTPENMIKLVDTGCFETVLCQYNLLDRANEDAIAHAKDKGLGVIVMGPVGGGRLGEPSPVVQALLPGKVQSSPEIALRFVLSNPAVSCALSGMGTPLRVNENVDISSNASPLTAQEQERITASMKENKERAKLYCTGCNYCMPCPSNVNIPLNFELMNYHRVYGLTDYARQEYAQIGKVAWRSGEKNAAACVNCGKCEDKCPQHLKICDQLKETAMVLG